MRYKGQSFELTVPIPRGSVTAQNMSELEEAFGREHEITYGHRAGPDEPVEIVNLQVIGQGLSDRPRVPDAVRIEPDTAKRPSLRKAYFGAERGWVEVPVLARADLAAGRIGPCIVEEYDATCVVPVGAQAALDSFGNIIIDLAE